MYIYLYKYIKHAKSKVTFKGKKEDGQKKVENFSFIFHSNFHSYLVVLSVLELCMEIVNLRESI